MSFGDEDDDRLKKRKNKLAVIGIRKPERMLLHGTSLASVESLSLPLVSLLTLSLSLSYVCMYVCMYVCLKS